MSTLEALEDEKRRILPEKTQQPLGTEDGESRAAQLPTHFRDQPDRVRAELTHDGTLQQAQRL
jgi:hypothetical protein